MVSFDIERGLLERGFCFICGVDEVGRGALFGPVVSAAVILNPDRIDPRINDSKKLSPSLRLKLAEVIYNDATAYSIGWCWNDEIDRINILNATRKSMVMAVKKLQVTPDYILIDGTDGDFLPIRGQKVVKGDSRSFSIAAASILAKVFRDDLIDEFGRFFPQYDLTKNKGYPTQSHRSVISLAGITCFHRRTFGRLDSIRGRY